MVKALDKTCERWGMHISVEKTKILAVGEQEPYISSEVGQATGVEKVVTVRLKKESTVYQMLRRKIFKSRNLSKSTKVRVF